jgi:hypothetical protein
MQLFNKVIKAFIYIIYRILIGSLQINKKICLKVFSFPNYLVCGLGLKLIVGKKTINPILIKQICTSNLNTQHKILIKWQDAVNNAISINNKLCLKEINLNPEQNRLLSTTIENALKIKSLIKNKKNYTIEDRLLIEIHENMQEYNTLHKSLEYAVLIHKLNLIELKHNELLDETIKQTAVLNEGASYKYLNIISATCTVAGVSVLSISNGFTGVDFVADMQQVAEVLELWLF